MNFENLNETTKLRLRNNGINTEDDLINNLLDRIIELEEINNINNINSQWRKSRPDNRKVVDADV